MLIKNKAQHCKLRHGLKPLQISLSSTYQTDFVMDPILTQAKFLCKQGLQDQAFKALFRSHYFYFFIFLKQILK